MKNKIINVDNISELNCVETNYWSIINFFKGFTADWYSSRNIYFEQHHIYPRSEIGCEIPIVVNLPYKYHFLAHYYRALESTDYRTKLLNYNACQVMIGKNKNVEYIKSCFPEEFYKMKSFIINNPSYTKKVINLETKQIFNTTKEAADFFGVNYHIISNACKNKDDYYKNSCYKTKYVSYYDETKPLSYYEGLLEHYKSIPQRKKKAWTDEDLKKRALANTGKKFVQSKSKKVVNVITGVMYDSTTKAGELLGIDRHEILKSCRTKQPLFLSKGICNFRFEEDFIGVETVDVISRAERGFLEKLKNLGVQEPSSSSTIKTKYNQYFDSISDLHRKSGMSRSTITRYVGKYIFRV